MAVITTGDGDELERRVGHGIDPRGQPVMDPTKNVLDLVKAESKYQDSMREALKEYLDKSNEKLAQFQDYARQAESRFQTLNTTALSNINAAKIEANTARIISETKRLDQLATQRKEYEQTIANIIDKQKESNSTLVASQLLQIQSTFNERVSKLEQLQLLSTGRSSVNDPASLQRDQTIADAMNKMAATIALIQTSGEATKGRQMGRGDIGNWIAGAIAIGSALLLGIAAIYEIVTHTH